jgi:hypothetical protein
MNFELQLSVPRDPRYAAMVRGVAEHAARYAGGGGANAERFGLAVEAAAPIHLPATGEDMPVTVRRQPSGLEVQIGRQTITLDL